MDKYISEFTKQLTLRNLTQKTISGYTQGLNYFLKKCREQIPSLTGIGIERYVSRPICRRAQKALLQW